MMTNYSEYGCIGICLLILLVLVIGFAADCFVGWIVMLLWNWLAPLFWTTAPILTYWESVGVVILLSIIGGFFKNTKTK